MLIPLYCNVEETNTVGDTIITLIPEHVQGISIEDSPCYGPAQC